MSCLRVPDKIVVRFLLLQSLCFGCGICFSGSSLCKERSSTCSVAGRLEDQNAKAAHG